MCGLEEALCVGGGHDPPASPLLPSRGGTDLSPYIHESRTPGKSDNGHSFNSRKAAFQESGIVPWRRIALQAESGHQEQQPSRMMRARSLGESEAINANHFTPTIVHSTHDLIPESFLILCSQNNHAAKPKPLEPSDVELAAMVAENPASVDPDPVQ